MCTVVLVCEVCVRICLHVVHALFHGDVYMVCVPGECLVLWNMCHVYICAQWVKFCGV